MQTSRGQDVGRRREVRAIWYVIGGLVILALIIGLVVILNPGTAQGRTISRDQAVEIARQAVQGAFKPEELSRTDVKLDQGQYVVTFVLTVPPGSVGSGSIQVTLDAYSGQVLKKLRDAD